ncbi:C-type lectin mannose-binding isoform-like [Liolophura sinensis]|uniref:C-type lectin mannose-binding isoform-like n=1 Tax=Liolophura sinensis TaxID=3198878 RepID=UPI003158CB8C
MTPTALLALIVLVMPSPIWTHSRGIHLSCPQDGWNLLDGSCVKLLKDHIQGWKAAQSFCQSVGARLVRLDDHWMTQMAGELAEVSNFWIGFSTNSQKQSTWADNSVSSPSVGFWSDGFPYPAEDKCVYVTNSSGLYLWSEGSCDLLMNYMCQRSACSQGSFHCSRDACINEKWVCDGVDDCRDYSDELGCSSRCSYHQKGSVGTITQGDLSQDICYWLIEGPMGSNIKLNVRTHLHSSV